MNRIKITATILAITVLLAACGSSKLPPSSGQDDGSTIPNTSSSSSQSASTSDSGSQSSGEALFYGQPDPTLPENMQGSFLVWNNLEYQSWSGDVSTYKEHRSDLIFWDDIGTPSDYKAVVKLPPNLSLSYSSIEYDGGFANGTIRIGSVAGAIYPLQEGETLENNKRLPMEFFKTDPLSGDTFTLQESTDNTPGAYVKGTNYIRYITESYGTRNMTYVIKLDGYLTNMFFFISPDATSEDLKLYDQIVDTLRLTK